MQYSKSWLINKNKVVVIYIQYNPERSDTTDPTETKADLRDSCYMRSNYLRYSTADAAKKYPFYPVLT